MSINTTADLELLEYDSERGAYRFQYCSSPSEAVIQLIEAIETTERTRSGPVLYDAIDPDALDALLGNRSPPREGDMQVTFRYDGYEVTILSYGVIRAKPLQGPETEP